VATIHVGLSEILLSQEKVPQLTVCTHLPILILSPGGIAQRVSCMTSAMTDLVTLVALEHRLPSTLYCLMIEAGRVCASCVFNLSIKHSEMLTPVSAELSR